MRYVRETGLFSKEAIKRKFSAIETKFEVQQGTISAIISESDLQELKNGDTTLFNRLASAKLDIEQLDLRFSRQQSDFSAAQGQITTLQTQSAAYQAGINGLTANLTRLDRRLTNDYSTTVEMETQIQASIDSVSSTISALREEVEENYATTDYVSSQISQTADNITQSVSSTYATKSYVSTATSTAETNAKTAAQTMATNAETNAKTAADGYAKAAKTEAITAAGVLANTAKTDAMAAAQGYANRAESNATTAADGYAKAAKTEAITAAQEYANKAKSDANEYTDGKLLAYSTTSEVESKIEQTANGISQSVSATYATKTFVTTAANTAETNATTAARSLATSAETNAKTAAQTMATNAETNAKTAAKTLADKAEENATSAAQGFANTAKTDAMAAAQGYANRAESNATTAANGYTDNKLKAYSTTVQMRSAIDQKADSITQSVSATYAKITSVSAMRDDLDALGEDTVRQVRVEYAQSDSPLVAPTTGWSTGSPEWVDGKFIWQRVATLKNGEWSYSNVTCVTGATGHGSYAHVKYSNDGGETFTGNNGDDVGEWMGIYVDSNEEAKVNGRTGIITPNNKRILLYGGKRLAIDHSMTDLYTWVLIKGAQGDPGMAGAMGVGIVDSVPEYYLSASNIYQAGGEWSTSMQPYVAGRYYWTRLKTTYTDGTIKYSEPEIYDIYNGLYDKVIELEEWSEISKRTQTKNTISDLVESSQTFMQVANRAEFFVQDHAPASPRTGDTWIDTSDGNVIKRYDGQNWVSVRDAGTTDLIRIIGAPDDYSGMSLIQRISSAEQKITSDAIVSVVQQANVFVSDDEANAISVTQAKSVIAQWYDTLDISVDKINIESSEVGFGLNLAVANEHSERSVEIAKLPPAPSGTMKLFQISGGYLTANAGYTCITGLKWNRFTNGESFWLSFRGKRSSSSALNIKIRIAFFNTANALVAYSDASFDLTTSDKAFEQVMEVNNSSVDGASWYAIYAQLTGSGYASIRQMRIYQQSKSVVIADGAITANKITTNAVDTDQLKANAVTTKKLATDAIKSLNYAEPDGTQDKGEHYATAGSFFNLAQGILRSKNFVIDSEGSAFLRGTITATGGKIAKLNITADAIYSGEKNAFDSTKPGIWVGPDGSMALGGIVDGTNNYLKYNISTGKMQLALDTLTVAGKNMATEQSVSNALELIQKAQEAADQAQDDADTANGGLVTANRAIDSIRGIAEGASSTASSAFDIAGSAADDASTALSTANAASDNADSALAASSAAQTAASGAVSTADAASRTAASADSTARSASTVAQGAATTAGTAKTTADNAKTVADGAKTTADNAKTTADGAKTTADAAKTTADGAKTTADEAKGTADEAKTAADQAAEDAEQAKSDAAKAKSDAEAAISGVSNAQRIATDFINYSVNEGLILGNIAGSSLGYNLQLAPNQINFRYNGNILTAVKPDSYNIYNNNVLAMSVQSNGLHVYAPTGTSFTGANYFECCSFTSLGIDAPKGSIGNTYIDAGTKGLRTVNYTKSTDSVPKVVQIGTKSVAIAVGTGSTSSWDGDQEVYSTLAYVDYSGNLSAKSVSAEQLRSTLMLNSQSANSEYVVTIDSYGQFRKSDKTIPSLTPSNSGISYQNLCSYLDSDSTVRNKVGAIASSYVSTGMTYSNLCSYLDSDSTVRSKVGSIASGYATTAAQGAAADYISANLDSDVSSLVNNYYSYTRSTIVSLINSLAGGGSSVTKNDVINWVNASTTIMNKAANWTLTNTESSSLVNTRERVFNEYIDARLRYYNLINIF